MAGGTYSSTVYDEKDATDAVWVLTCAAMVFFMQCGFALLECGSVREKNSTSILIKNLFDAAAGALAFWLVGFGWARPVPIYPPAFRAYRLGLFAVSVAGILVNLALAVLFALTVRGLFALDPEGVYGAFRGSGGSALGLLALAAYVASSINLVLAVFNLLPIPPLDGSKILQSLLPLAWHPWLWRLEQYAWLSFLLILTVLRGPIQEVLAFARRVFFTLLLG